MREILLEAGKLTDRALAQEYLRARFAFPDYYGKNLDALRDMLGELDDTRVVVRGSEPLGGDTGYLGRVLRVFADAALENPRLTLVIEGDPEGE